LWKEMIDWMNCWMKFNTEWQLYDCRWTQFWTFTKFHNNHSNWIE
jgi:hypothetical protein